MDLEFKFIDLPTTFRIIANMCRTNIRNAHICRFRTAVNQATTKQAQTTQPHQTGQTAGTTKKWHVHFHENNGPPSLVIIAPHAVFVTTCFRDIGDFSTVSPTPNSQSGFSVSRLQDRWFLPIACPSALPQFCILPASGLHCRP